MKKAGGFVLGGIAVIVLYCLGIGIYTRVSEDPIVFFASLVIGLIVAAAVCLLLAKVTRGLYDRFTVFVMGVVYLFGVIGLSVFGPTFIDRSISYHIAFYAVEEGKVNVDDIEEAFSRSIFEKRIHDATETGFLTVNDDGSLSPSFKAKLMYYTLKPLGDLTGSMETYNEMKEEIQNNTGG